MSASVCAFDQVLRSRLLLLSLTVLQSRLLLLSLRVASSAIAALKLLSYQCGTRRAVRTARSWMCQRVVIELWRCLACLLLQVQCLVTAIALIWQRRPCRNRVRRRWVLVVALRDSNVNRIGRERPVRHCNCSPCCQRACHPRIAPRLLGSGNTA